MNPRSVSSICFGISGKQVFEILVDIEIIGFCCLYYAIKDRACFGSVNGVYELPVFLPNTKRPDSLLSRVVIKRYLWIRKKFSQILFLIKAVFYPVCCLG